MLEGRGKVNSEKKDCASHCKVKRIHRRPFSYKLKLIHQSDG